MIYNYVMSAKRQAERSVKPSLLQSYYRLTKPGIIYGNITIAAAGFFLAAKGDIYLWLFLAMMFGLSFVIASACVFNNYIDQDIDAKMDRTRNRALVKKVIPVRNALIYGIVLGLLGFSLLAFFTNLLTTFVAFIGFFFYVVMYSIWKRRSSFGTIVGSVSGAVPPVVGYCAVTNQLDIGAIILFLMLVLWQMPHFYAIAIFRQKEYGAANIPILPIVSGIHTTKIHMLFYIAAFTLVALCLSVFGYTGIVYLVVAAVLGVAWFVAGVKGFKTENTIIWARKMFGYSLIILITLAIMMAVNYIP